jgi:SnoaL-like polyketide cyclase
MMQAAFSDMKWDAQDILVDGDKAVARVRFTGTNDGEFMGIARHGPQRQRRADRHRPVRRGRSRARTLGRARPDGNDDATRRHPQPAGVTHTLSRAR